MTKIDFYLLPYEAQEEYNKYICYLIEKIYHKELKVLVNCIDQDHLAALDKRLWTFRDISFIPHVRIGVDIESNEKIQLGCLKNDLQGFDVLINCTQTMPSRPEYYARILEIIPNDEKAKAKGRKLYKDYQVLGGELSVHKI
ncbi:MAG: DNA polymerase III subunit chi [Gammaproteobacteria bacterium]|nr:DNA polymerase III subunit chi [Gammaproteobacteria bacterium]